MSVGRARPAVPGGMATRKRARAKKAARTRSVADLTADEMRALLTEVQRSVRSGVAMESSEEVGDLVLADLEKAGLDVSPLPLDEVVG